MKRRAIGNGAYEGEDKTYWLRVTINGSRTWRKLKARSERFALKEASTITGLRISAQRGLCDDPLAPPAVTTNLQTLADEYERSGCPNHKLEPRTPKQVHYEKSNLKWIRAYFGKHSPADIAVKDCPKYREWRAPKIVRGKGGDRQIDRELTSLSNLLSWAVTAEHIDFNKIGSKRPRFRREDEVVHCRERAPESADEVHKLASQFFRDPQSEVLGWQMLLEALTGCRTCEIIRLRMDAKPGQAGYIEEQYRHLHRAKKGVNPFTLIHPALRSLIEAHHEWHRIRFPEGNPWWLPGFRLHPTAHVHNASLSDALRRITALLNMEHRTSHGMRSFYVTVRRSQGASDAQVAAEIGDKTVELIRKTYGDIPPNWKGRPGLQWLPTTGEPAWAPWTPQCIPFNQDVTPQLKIA